MRSLRFGSGAGGVRTTLPSKCCNRNHESVSSAATAAQSEQCAAVNGGNAESHRRPGLAGRSGPVHRPCPVSEQDATRKRLRLLRPDRPKNPESEAYLPCSLFHLLPSGHARSR